MILAHGLGDGELPIDAVVLVWGVAVVILVSFVGLGVLWRKPALAQHMTGRMLWRTPPIVITVATLLGQGIAAGVLAVTIASGRTGTTFRVLSVTPWVVFIAVGVAMPFVSFLFGDVWRIVSPIRILGRAAAAAGARLGTRREAQLNNWPAVVALFGFFWLDLAYHSPGSPRVLSTLIIAYVIWAALPAMFFGVEWTDRADGLGWWFTTIASMAPWRSGNADQRVQWPVIGAARLPALRGSAMGVLVVVGSSAFDGLSRTAFWSDVIGDERGWAATQLATLGLVWSIAAVAAVYAGAVRLADRDTTQPAGSSERYFPSLVPLAFGLVVAHTFASLVFDGQTLFIRASDPFGDGSDWFGTAAWRENTRLVSSATISWIQISAILIGHAASTMLAHDRAVETAPNYQSALRTQFPILLALAAFAGGGMFLLLG